MRIISGIHKGRKLQPPSRIKARPTTDMAREALFNLLQAEINLNETDLLDLFCGTGAISLEFISRGGRSATSIDVDNLATRFLKSIVEEWKLANLRVVRADVFKLMKKPDRGFDFVFTDPPYAEPRYPQLPDLLLNSGWVNAGGLLVIEHSQAHSFAEHANFGFHKKYGSVNFSFFRN